MDAKRALIGVLLITAAIIIGDKIAKALRGAGLPI